MPKIKVIVKEPLEAPVVKEIDNGLESLQAIVGGYIEFVRLTPNSEINIILNEDGKLIGLPPNFVFGTDIIAGTVVFARQQGGETVSLNDEQIEFVMDVVHPKMYYVKPDITF